MGNWRFWAGFGIGLAAGAAIALVYAPQSGARTRRQIRRNWEDATEYVRDTANNVGEQAEKCYQRSRDAMNDFAGQAQTVVKTAKRVVTFAS